MLKNYFISFPNYIIFASVGITTDACHCYYFWNYYILILEWIPFWLKKGNSLLHCGAKDDLSWNILFWFRQCGLEIIICIWTISPISAGSNTKYEELVHLSFAHKTFVKPRLHSRAALGPLHTVFQALTTRKGPVVVPIPQVWNWSQLRPSSFPKTTEGSEQELHGLAARGACTLPPCPASQDSQLLPDLHFFDAAWVSI